MEITDERNRLEQEIRQRLSESAASEERMRSVVDHVVDGIVTMDDRGTVESFNPAAQRIFGYTATEVVGHNFNLLMGDPYRSEQDGYLANYLRTGQAKIIGIGREVVGRRKDGTTFPMDLAVSEFRLGERCYFTGIIRDISEAQAGRDGAAQDHAGTGPLQPGPGTIRLRRVSRPAGAAAGRGRLCADPAAALPGPAGCPGQ